MKRLVVFALTSAALCPPALSQAERPPESVPVEKLPVELPELKVIGHEIKPDVNLGSKLPLEATASVGSLPAPPPARATTELLERLRLSVPAPPDGLQDAGIPVDRDPYTSMWGGLGALPLGGQLGSYDLGLYHGRRFGNLAAVTDATLNLHGLDRWSSIRLAEQLAWGEAAWGNLAYRREQQAGSLAAAAVQESGKLAASFSREALAFDLQGEVGQVTTTGLAGYGSVVAYGLIARADLQPEPILEGHLSKVGLQLGQLGATGLAGAGWNSQLLVLSASDRFEPLIRLAIAADLGLTLFRQNTYLDPGVRVEFRPGAPPTDDGVAESPTELWAAARTETRQPGFDDLYFSRLRTVGNADLRPQRIAPRLEIGAGHRFTERAYVSASAGMAQALDWIHYAPAGDGLWQPRNFATWQQVYDLGLDSQYLWTDFSLQKFSLKWRSPAGLGERLFSAGTRHESRLLDDRLALIAGLAVDYVELGPSQGGGQGLDLRADWEAGYRIEAGWQLFLAGKDWHVWQQEPAAGYFAVPAQITAGLEYDF